MTVQIEKHPTLKEEFSERLERARREGLVDFKAEIDVNNHSSTHDLLMVLNNVLRIREERPEPKFSF